MPAKKKPGKDLVDLEVEEISLVDASANRKKFAMIKSVAGETLQELLSFLQDEGSEKIAMQKVESLGTEDIGDYVEALSVLKKYDGCFPCEILDALAVLVGLCPQLQKAEGMPITKFAEGGAFDTLFRNLVAVSNNPRMIKALQKGDLARGLGNDDDELDLEDEVTPGRGVSKSAKGQDDVLEDGEVENKWPSL
jgi:hypothetical protein